MRKISSPYLPPFPPKIREAEPSPLTHLLASLICWGLGLS